MKKLALFIIAFLIPFAAVADSVRFTVGHPTTRINGDPLPQSEIVEFSIQCGLGAGSNSFADLGYIFPADQTPGATETVFDTPDEIGAGTYECRVRTIVTDPDGGPNLAPSATEALFTFTQFTVVTCTPSTCGATAAPVFTAVVL